MRALTSSLLLIAASPAASQSGVVSPASFTNAEATSSTAVPFGIPTAPYRYVGIHDDLAGTPRPLKGMAVRRNGNSTGSHRHTP